MSVFLEMALLELRSNDRRLPLNLAIAEFIWRWSDDYCWPSFVAEFGGCEIVLSNMSTTFSGVDDNVTQ